MTSGEPRIRRARREHGWTTINNAPAVDPALSWEAVGVLTYLLTKPDDWEVLTAHLVKFRKGGRDRMRRIMGELRAAGYMKLVRERDAGGRILDTFYEIADLPELLAHRPTENPADGEIRQTAEPSDGKHDPLLSTDPVPSTEGHKENIAASNDDAARAADPAPPETLVKAGTTNPNGTATQPSRERASKPEVVEVTPPAAPGKVSQADIRAMVEAMAAARGYPPANFSRHTRAAKRLILLGHTPGDVTRTVAYIRRECAHLNGQPVTMETVSKYIGIAAPIRLAPTPGTERELPDWMAA